MEFPLFGEQWAFTLVLHFRLLALSNLIAFISYLSQWRGLVGSTGLAPAYLNCGRRGKVRGLCRFGATDDMLKRLLWGGFTAALCGCLLPWSWLAEGMLSSLLIACCALCYFSLVEVSGPFMGLQMHSCLVETNLLYCATAPFASFGAPGWPFALTHWAITFRVMVGGGAGKWAARDASWRDGTAMKWHYWTQPLPNPLSHRFHALPDWIHRLETYFMFVIEGPLTFLMFSPLPGLRVPVFIGASGLMAMINTSGNYGHLGFITVVQCITLLNDDWWRWVLHFEFLQNMVVSPLFPFSQPEPSTGHVLWAVVACLIGGSVALAYALISMIPLKDAFGGQNPLLWIYGRAPFFYNTWRKFNASSVGMAAERIWGQVEEKIDPLAEKGQQYCLFGRYVKFASMSKTRWEIIIEGTVDGKSWTEVPFKYKPSDVKKKPPVIPGHMPSLDWRLWFLSLDASRGRYSVPGWFENLLRSLIDRNPHVIRLVDWDGPFPEFSEVRGVLYDYRFPREAKYDKQTETLQSGQSRRLPDPEKDDWWWRKHYCGQYGPTMKRRKEVPTRQA